LFPHAGETNCIQMVCQVVSAWKRLAAKTASEGIPGGLFVTLGKVSFQGSTIGND